MSGYEVGRATCIYISKFCKMTFFEKLERFGLYSYDGIEGSQTVFQVKKRYYIDRKIVQKLLFYEFKNI